MLRTLRRRSGTPIERDLQDEKGHVFSLLEDCKRIRRSGFEFFWVSNELGGCYMCDDMSHTEART